VEPPAAELGSFAFILGAVPLMVAHGAGAGPHAKDMAGMTAEIAEPVGATAIQADRPQHRPR
jgi:hypothetical protein